MRLTCPTCGAAASAESWSNDMACREVLALITRLPQPLPRVAVDYLGLFRPGERGLSWKKALRIAGEIGELVRVGYVSVPGQVDRNCSASVWARGMEQMAEQRSALRLPMKNHNYLKRVVWDLANHVDREREKVGPVKRDGRVLRTSDPLEKARREWDEKHKGNGETLGVIPTGFLKDMNDAD